MKNLRVHLLLSLVVVALMASAAVTGCKSASNAVTASPAQAGNVPSSTAGNGNAANNGGQNNTGNSAPAGAAAKVGSNGAPKPMAGTPQKVTLTVEPGVDIHARIRETITSKTAQVGDPFSGTLTSDLTTRSGEVVIAKGAAVTGTVVSSKGQGRFKGAGVLAIELEKVSSLPVSASEYVVSAKGKGKRSTALIGGGAGGGALIGGLAGGKKGALIGGLLGAGAGTLGAAFSGNKELVIPAESEVVFELSKPISKTVER